jgi:hypothetical protein
MAKQRFAVTDAHGRLVTLIPAEQQPQTQAVPAPRARRQHGSTAVTIAGIFVGGVVAVVLLIVIRDIATTVAGGGVTGLILQGLFRLCRKER